MTNECESREVVIDAFLDCGFSLASAESFSDFTICLSRQLAVIELHRILSVFTPTIFGTALHRELCGEQGESLRAAARRLRCSPAALRSAQKKVRECLEDLKSHEALPPHATIPLSENH